ncbi:PhoD-like phosphatase-domain-containing protein [Infundibulicybe gibba]|nr:PhoD-like phosphatase-domain-containing protein [Infundibulicybe gibba]
MKFWEYVSSIASTLFRLAVYVFLQIIPSRLAKPVLPTLYTLYISSTFLPQATEPALPSSKRWIRITNLAVNTILLLAAADAALAPFWDHANHVVFTRVRAVNHDSLKIVARYPFATNTRIRWRETDGEWSDGPTFNFTEELDWVDTISIGGLSSATDYEYTIDNITVYSVRTFPEPGQPSRFTFLASSCITPNFPYRGPWARRSIRGFDYIATYLRHPTAFMMFLGDFIYADVPVYIGDDKNAYRRLYRRNHASEEFRSVFERLPIFHTYDDHEFINNYAGADHAPPYTNAVDAYKIYNGDGSYYDFEYGDTSFFVMDTRLYRDKRTMLGDTQVRDLISWLERVNNTHAFKFIVSSVPFTSLWTHDAQVDSWAAFAEEKAQLMQVLCKVPNVLVISGDRHEFAEIELLCPDRDQPVREFSTSPTSMFYIPFIRTLQPKTDEAAEQQEKVIKYVPTGNYKFSAFEVDTLNSSKPVVRVSLIVAGEMVYRTEIVGTPLPFLPMSPSTALGTFFGQMGVQEILDRLGVDPRRWF